MLAKGGNLWNVFVKTLWISDSVWVSIYKMKKQGIKNKEDQKSLGIGFNIEVIARRFLKSHVISSNKEVKTLQVPSFLRVTGQNMEPRSHMY